MKDGVLALWVYVLLGIPFIAVLSYARNKKHSEKKREEENDKRNSRE